MAAAFLAVDGGLIESSNGDSEILSRTSFLCSISEDLGTNEQEDFEFVDHIEIPVRETPKGPSTTENCIRERARESAARFADDVFAKRVVDVFKIFTNVTPKSP